VAPFIELGVRVRTIPDRRVDNTRGDALPKEQAHYLKEEPEPSVAIAVKGARGN